MNNSLAAMRPELVREWSDKNLLLTPDKISYGSNKIVWWKAACGHEWQTSVKARSKSENCPICSGASLEDIRLFHTDRGNEFKNQTIEELLETFRIERSLSHKGCPYDNAVAEAIFKIIKTEFVWNETFANLSELKLKLWDYVHWYNHHRIHSALGYETPVQYRENNLKKVV